MSLPLENKRVLLTGGGTGIGAAICRALHRDGAEVAIHYNRSVDSAQQLADELGTRVRVIPGELSGENCADNAEDLWRRAVEVLGGVDVLVNNAGAWLASPIAPVDEWKSGWDANMKLNLEAPALLSRAAVETFRAQGGGAIVSIVSRSAHRGDDAEHLAYGVAKAGLHNLMKGIARGYAGDGVLAYSIAPGWVATGLAQGNIEQSALDALPLGEVTPPEEVGEIVSFLASGRARHLTGATLDITGADYVR
ncbi:SDR family NAD(P)-dependent oxidoreductase [Corynebacterium stationis]|uniref:SDR family NAD(P)-dependent oxidoreductase n=1 Tax=Corynebacterium stationis TaxID=1705 RepID=UPI00076F5C3A|nr:SDR family oxidoreductase [Corynebacterium stationis]AMJ45111.1 short-chain dehydrogenase [Corynebacterium stationis]AQX71566.1 short-chain dehydrogenase [Corynebacterium stationis]ASJ19249.1 short-chain dehydrogenase [Corynebacterium stationis]HJG64195.1 SDR family oxidoreductase [Corynebacterium stationis]